MVEIAWKQYQLEYCLAQVHIMNRLEVQAMENLSAKQQQVYLLNMQEWQKEDLIVEHPESRKNSEVDNTFSTK